MARILVAWELGAGLGHCTNLQPIIAGIIARGHHVTAAVRDLHTARASFGNLPVNYFQAPIQHTRAAKPIDSVRSFSQLLYNVGFDCAENLSTLAAEWTKTIGLVHPSAVLCEHAPAALLAAHIADLPRAVLGTGFFCPPNRDPFPGFFEPSGDASCDRMADQQVLNAINDILRHSGKSVIDRAARLYTKANDTFLLTFAELDHYRHRARPTYYGMWPPTGGEIARWPSAGNSRVFAYLQPSVGTWRPAALFAPLADHDISALIYAPSLAPEIRDRFRSSKIQFAAERIDLTSMTDCSLAITHGNNGTVTNLLLAGVPQLILPLFVEQEVFRRRVIEIGASVDVPYYRTGEIATVITTLLESAGPRDAAQAFAGKHRNYDAAAAVDNIVDRIESLC